jgi:methylenetetrahydrofolate reductase (NADPH)
VLRKYGLSLTRLVGSAGPDPILADLADGLNPAAHGETRLHFYPFGGFVKTAEWISQYRSAQGV